MFSPLEQFIILPVFVYHIYGYDIIVTNSAIILALVFFVWYAYSFMFIKPYSLDKPSCLQEERIDLKFLNNDKIQLLKKKLNKVEQIKYFVSHKPITRLKKIPAFFFWIYKCVFYMLKGNVKHPKAQKFFPLIFFIFLTIFFLNLIGLVPFSFTVTSHIVVTLGISLSMFIGMIIISIRKHGFNFLLLFKPSGISLGLLFLLTPIELISFLVKPISLSIRLFANMMAGHTLLKVIGGFAFTLSLKSGILYILHYIPLLVIVPLYGLEFAVALIQTFVFATLLTIYLNESLNLH